VFITQFVYYTFFLCNCEVKVHYIFVVYFLDLSFLLIDVTDLLLCYPLYFLALGLAGGGVRDASLLKSVIFFRLSFSRSCCSML